MPLPDVHFGVVGSQVDWRKAPAEPQVDDDELSRTPPDVTALLGFDPKELMQDAEKVSKSSVHYSKGYKPSHCGICVHFEKPHACERVAGSIDPTYWCRLFKKTGS